MDLDTMDHNSPDLRGEGQGPGWAGQRGYAGSVRESTVPADEHETEEVPPGDLRAGDRLYDGDDGFADERDDLDDFAPPQQRTVGASRKVKIFFAVAAALGAMVVIVDVYNVFIRKSPAKTEAALDYKKAAALEADATSGRGIAPDPVSQMTAPPVTLPTETPPSSAVGPTAAAPSPQGGRNGSELPTISPAADTGPSPSGTNQVAARSPSISVDDFMAMKQSIDTLRSSVTELRESVQQTQMDAATTRGEIATLKQQIASTDRPIKKKEREAPTHKSPAAAMSHGQKPMHKSRGVETGASEVAATGVCLLKGATDGAFDTGQPTAWITSSGADHPAEVRRGQTGPCIGTLLSVYADGAEWVVHGSRSDLRTGGRR